MFSKYCLMHDREGRKEIRIPLLHGEESQSEILRLIIQMLCAINTLVY